MEFNGENEQIMDAMEQLLLMLLLGVVLVYFIMVAQFQSLKSPFIVMFTIPLAFTGGFLALLIAGIEVSVISLIGFVMLVGIIVNNGIVLVDYINQQRLSGMERREAIIDAGVTRLRPILMTSLTTILGLIVTATAKNAGTALMQPIAVVCIGGLLYATLMTLFVVPCMYDMMNKKDMQKVDESELLGQIGLQLADGDTHLLHGVALADGDAVVGRRVLVAHGVEVHGDAERRADSRPRGGSACRWSRSRRSPP